jgi:multisubunit Na+/H+ antiporter MnhF subunit
MLKYGSVHAPHEVPHMALKFEVIDKVAALITAAFGLIAALAWNTAIQAIFIAVFGVQSSIAAMLSYAIIVTIIAVIATIWIGRVAERSKGEEQKTS